MSPRPRIFKYTRDMQLGLLEHAIASYYAHKYGKSISEILQGMLVKTAKLDGGFDKKAFHKFVKDHLIPKANEDPALKNTIRTQVDEMLGTFK